MRNKFLTSLVTLIVFFNFTIPSYVLAAPKAYSRNVKALPTPEKAVSAQASSEISGNLPEYKLPVEETMPNDTLSELRLRENLASSFFTGQQEGTIAMPLDPRTAMPSSQASSLNEKDYVEGQFFVRFKNPADKPGFFDNLSAGEVFSASPSLKKIAAEHDIRPSNIKRLFAALTDSSRSSIREKASTLKNTFTLISYTNDSARFLEELNKDPNVVYAERVPKMKSFYTPNDPQYASQWHLDKVQASQAWDIYNANPNNSEVVIAIVDDAVKLGHEDLQANIWINPGEIPNNGIDDDGNGYIDDINGWDAAMNDNDPNPPSTATNSYFMHGTHVAGIAAAVSNNAKGVASLSQGGQNKIRLMAVKAKEDASPGDDIEAALEGVTYAIAAGADIINMSFAGLGFSQTFEDLCIVARQSGVVLVGGAGNSGQREYMFPASYLYVTSVAATDQMDMPAYFSTSNNRVDVSAPGVDVLSTLPVGNNSYGMLSGTSMSTPLVTGLCAMLKSYNNALSPYQIEKVIKQTSFFPSWTISGYGSGRIDALAAMQAIQAGNIPLDEAFTAVGMNGIGQFNFSSFDWGDYDNDGDLDLAIMGQMPIGGLQTKIYRNDGGSFVDINAALQGAGEGDLAWGDYDNDGYLDLVVSGESAPGSYFAKLYRNNQDGTFAQAIDLQMPVHGSSVSWGDYDNDGDLDLLVSGYTVNHPNGVQARVLRNDNGVFVDSGITNLAITGKSRWGDYNNDGRLDILGFGPASSYGAADNNARIYRNDGNNVFTKITTPFSGASAGDLQWGDYDNDGDLDVLLGGMIDGSNGVPSGKMLLYKNNNGAFALTSVSLPGGGGGQMSWGDYDNDGYLDIVASGVKGNAQYRDVVVYRNNQNGTFSEVNAEFDWVYNGDTSWVDYDNDGKLEFMVTGWYDIYNSVTGYSFQQLITRLYKSKATNVNTPASAPSSLLASVADTDVTLTWQKSTDAQTPQNGLNYNIYLGTSANSQSVATPMSRMSDGWRKIKALGHQRASQSANTASYTVKDLACGTTYYWGVQAIDTAFAGSEFAIGTPFTADACPGSNVTISGTVTSGGQGLSGVDIQEGAIVLATTNSNGFYSFVKIAGWSGSITPSKTGYTFTPPSATFNNIASNQTQNFVGTINTFTLNYNAGSGGSISGLTPQTVNYGGSGTEVTAVANPGYSFAGWSDGVMTASRTDANVTANLTVTANFTINIYTVSGTVLTSGGQVPPGATVNGVAVDPVTGAYSIPNITYGTVITLVPSAIGYTFTPPNATLTVTSNMIQNFIGNLSYFNITGVVHTPNGPGEGFAINVTNNNPNLPAVASTVSQSDGTYALSVPYGWNGAVQAAKSGYIVVDPQNGIYVYTNVIADQANMNYKTILESYTISGVIEYADGSGPMADVQLKDDANNLLAVTAADGSYSFEKEYGWSAVVTPFKNNHVFDPQQREYIDLQSNHLEEHYKAKKVSIVISGTIVSSPQDMPLEGVALRDNDGAVVATTNAEGMYHFEKPIGWSGIITPSKPRYAFTPQQRKYENVQTNLSQEHYIARSGG